jgi:putative SOS response-associated peptidase YedK
MCGRYSLRDPQRCFAEFSILENPAALEPRYNVAPSQGVWAIRVIPPSRERRLDLLRWGFSVPRRTGARETAMARAESLPRRFPFADAFASRRCLLLADGFYEWRKSGGRSVPHYFHRPDGAPFTIAGIWQPGPPSQALDGCAVITRPALPPVDAVHDRMPALLAPAHHQAWLDPAFEDRAALEHMLLMPSPFELVSVTVGPRVNSPFHDDAGCIAPLASTAPRAAEQLALFATAPPREAPSTRGRRSKSPWR